MKAGTTGTPDLFVRLKQLAEKKNRARLALVLGCAAMALILLS